MTKDIDTEDRVWDGYKPTKRELIKAALLAPLGALAFYLYTLLFALI